MKTSVAPWTNGPLEVQKKSWNHLRMFLHDTPENWSIQESFFLFFHNTQRLSHLHFSPYGIFFSYATTYSTGFQIDLSQSSFCESTAQY